jgi:uncharacterized protein
VKKKLCWLVLCLFILSFLAVGCQQPAAPTAPEAPDSGEKEEAPPPAPEKPSIEFLSIVTGGTGGVYFPYGGGMSTVINRYVPYLRATAEVTGASVENTRMISEKTAELALIMNDVGFQAYNGEGRFEGDPQPIRTVFQMYPHHYHVVVLANSNVQKIEDIRGKRVSIGAPGSGTEFKTDLVLTSLGIDYEEFTVSRLPFAETGADLRDGRIDVGIWDVAAPTSSVMEITATRDIRLISFSEEEIKKITSEYPFYSRFEMPAGTYPKQDQPIVNPSVWNSVICHVDYPEDYVYDIVKSIFENIDHLVAIHHFAKFTTPENTIEHSALPLHPGAIKYFKELGLDIPDHLIPPEMK